MLPPLYSLIKSSKAITIILISSGREPIQGTPFDKKINDVYEVYGAEVRKAKLPFVTSLVGRLGQPVAYSVNSTLGPVQVPDLRLPVKPQMSSVKTNDAIATNATVAVTKPVEPKPRMAKQNIIITKSTIANELPAANAAVTEGKTNSGSESTPSVVPAMKSVAETSGGGVPPLPDSPSQEAKTAAVNLINTSGALAHADPSTFKPEPQRVNSPADAPAPSLKTKPGKMMEHNDTPDPSILTNIQSGGPLVATQTVQNSKMLLLIAMSLALFAALLILVLIRSSRRKSGQSLISRSMNRPSGS